MLQCDRSAYLLAEPLSAYPPGDQKDAYCRKFLCECDSEAARCFSRSYYNSTLVGIHDDATCNKTGKVNATVATQIR